MKPGRGLDALVAKKVMNWSHDPTEPMHRYWFDANGEYVNDGLPNYSTDITAAWEIVMKMATKDRKVGQWGGFKVSWDDHGWVATFWREYAFGDTAPHAMCLAALKALGVEVENG